MLNSKLLLNNNTILRTAQLTSRLYQNNVTKAIKLYGFNIYLVTRLLSDRHYDY